MDSTITLTLDWREAVAEMPEAQQEALTAALFREAQNLEEVERVERLADADVPDGGMGAAWLWSILTAEITIDGIKKLGQEAQARLPGKPIEFTVKSGESSISVKNLRPEDLDATLDKLVEAAKALVKDNDQTAN